MYKGEGGSEALKCCLGGSASMEIILRSPGLCLLLSQRYICSTRILLLNPLRVFLLLQWSSMAIRVRDKGFPMASEGLHVLTVTPLLLGTWGKSVHIQSSFMEFMWVSPPLSLEVLVSYRHLQIPLQHWECEIDWVSPIQVYVDQASPWTRPCTRSSEVNLEGLPSWRSD